MRVWAMGLVGLAVGVCWGVFGGNWLVSLWWEYNFPGVEDGFNYGANTLILLHTLVCALIGCTIGVMIGKRR